MVLKLTSLCFGLLCVLLVLTGCVGKVGPVCFGSGPAGPPTASSQGPVIISTDHTVYAPSDAIIVLITNTLDTAIYIRSAPGCPTLLLSWIEDGKWQAIYLCRKTEAAPGIRGYTIAAHASEADICPSVAYQKRLLTALIVLDCPTRRTCHRVIRALECYME